MLNRSDALAATFLALTTIAASQTTPTCTIRTDSVTPSCTGSGWYSGITTCAHRTVSCSTLNGVTINDIGITFGYATPASARGTIVFFSPEGGTKPSDTNYDEATYAAHYYASPQNYQVVQTQWDSAGANKMWRSHAQGRPQGKGFPFLKPPYGDQSSDQRQIAQGFAYNRSGTGCQ